MKLLRRLRLRVSRPNAPPIRVALRFVGKRPSVDDCAGFDVRAKSPPESTWPFRQLRHLGIEQWDDYFCVPSDEPTEDHWGAALWILPLQDSPLGLQPVTIWRTSPLDGLGQVETLLHCVREFTRVLDVAAELRFNARPATVTEVADQLPRDLADWVVD